MDTLPDVTLTAIDGRPLPLKDQPLPLVVYFYPKDDTAGCTREAQDFSALATDFAAAGTAVIGVSKDPPAKHEKFVSKYDLLVTLASDEDGSACEAFGTWVQKSMYGRQYMGIERATFLFGRDGRLVRAWRKVKVPGHAAEVLAAARAL
ncbi:peroxiredoxin [Sphingomonas sp.]|jgi:peroxiredoxin Q/BCP|uniref:peroxiredoxin n=1 Tax=Sphingomonas sp. TaxID=28214 RepID=UPI002621232B|nr:peroxiredoxin [Sphingomonas sp.]MDF2495207.1 alkyl hydroperoxide reductase [Sphingomonas sp.]